MPSELEKLITDILHTNQALSKPYPSDGKLNMPATVQQITKLENMLGKSLPPSYKAFLKLHNGWAGFDYRSILSTEDYEKDWVKQSIKKLDELFDYAQEQFQTENPFKRGAIPIILGDPKFYSEDEHTYLLLDPSTTQKNGEMDFIEYDLTTAEKHYKNFTLFLKEYLVIKKELLIEK